VNHVWPISLDASKDLIPEITRSVLVSWQYLRVSKEEFQMKQNLLRKLYTDELKVLYSAENQFARTLARLSKEACSTYSLCRVQCFSGADSSPRQATRKTEAANRNILA